jgi:glycosyltransferase involved in cell wall biosynthesis
MNFLFVVHRYAPYPGGSEIYVQAMAEESKKKGHHVAVFAGEHQGTYNDIPVTSDTGILLQKWDLIIVHGGDVNVQNFVLTNAANIPSPILYLLILPSDSKECIAGLQGCTLVGCSTEEDWNHCQKHGVIDKAVRVRHGIDWTACIGKPGFKEKHNITGTMFVSCGGYYPNKAMRELADLFSIANLPNTTLVTTGYDNSLNLMPNSSPNIKPMLIDNRDEVLSAIYDADCLIMHSHKEGFGLVLLEALFNQTPWIARNIAGAKTLANHGWTYESDAELLTHLRNFSNYKFNARSSYEYVTNNHLISHTVYDIELALHQILNR